jgi:BMFP domain-containing protein YqiC
VSTDFIWETFDGLFKTVHRQGRRVEELEARIVDLERRLAERAASQATQPQPAPAIGNFEEMPAERAA